MLERIVYVSNVDLMRTHTHSHTTHTRAVKGNRNKTTRRQGVTISMSCYYLGVSCRQSHLLRIPEPHDEIFELSLKKRSGSVNVIPTADKRRQRCFDERRKRGEVKEIDGHVNKAFDKD